MAPPQSQPVTRLAPSPTGALHLGNARTFLINWALGRQRGWRIIMRMEDLDTPRVKPGADQLAFDDLAWLGIDWDTPPQYQLCDLSPYVAAIERLRYDGRAYACTCTRREIEAAQSAPHGDEHDMRYPGTCRDRSHAAAGDGSETPYAWRVHAPQQPIVFIDQIHGPQSIDVNAQVGDFVIATKSRLPAYQLAVVVDDARQGVTDVVRGDDLLASTGRQLWLYQLLGLQPIPRYWHLPLVLGSDGRRLAKRHGDTRLASYREAGVTAQRAIGLLAFWSGVSDDRCPMTIEAFRDAFDLARLPREPITFTQEDHRWLLDGA
jgi:glutamyl-tRNA synthetase